jgi:putative ubiquitin-RnfH superfamily antitoxin RatB of RatAB toxin-antitoxin module
MFSLYQARQYMFIRDFLTSQTYSIIRGIVSARWADFGYGQLNEGDILERISNSYSISYQFAKIVYNSIIQNEDAEQLLVSELKNVFVGIAIDAVLCPTLYYIYDTLKHNKYFMSRVQSYALETGLVTVDEALRFSHHCQFYALKAGATVDEALRFSDYSQSYALETGLVTVEEALRFSHHCQFYALKAGATVDEALRFSDYSQSHALETGLVTVEEALRFSDYYQFYALKAGATVEEALKCREVEPDMSDNGGDSQVSDAIELQSLVGVNSDDELV